ncbi:MAG: hypothetical protein CVU39_23760 [Chloroflexi bacterium HGW-Chloroflexi-10]|nr:MAG: hypothetical protein CVU39_23760 [Chloroflexi bacterium HGW-Chloroflexi-10]
MRRAILVFIILLLSIVSPVMAQTSINIDQMNVRIWPEYDRPSVLVIMNFFVDANIKLPAKVTINVPASTGGPELVAYRGLDEQLYMLDYDTQANGDWIAVTFTTPFAEIQLEYYDAFNVDGGTRSYQYRWYGDYAVNQFSFEVQRPMTATNMTFKESMGSAQVGPDGLTYYVNNVGTVESGTSFSLNMQYSKNDDVLSRSDTLSVEPSQPLTEEIEGRQSFPQILPILLAVLALVLIGLGLYWYKQTTGKRLPNERANRSHGSRKAAVVSDTDDPIYCHQCGKRASGSDAFCRSCGTRLRRGE